MFDTINLFLIATLFCNICLSLFVHFRSTKNASNRFFEYGIYAIVLWVLGMIVYRSANAEFLDIAVRILYVPACFIPSFFLLFSLYFPNEKPSKSSLFIIALSTLIVSVLCLIPNGVILDVYQREGRENLIEFGPAYPLYILHVVLLFSVFYFALIQKFNRYKRTNKIIKLQIQYVLLSSVIISSIAIVTNLILPTLGTFKLNWFGQIATSFWAGVITYAIIRHRLMDIRLVVARVVLYTLLMAILAGGYTGIIFILSIQFFEQELRSYQLILYAILALFVAFTYNPLKLSLEKATDKVFFKYKYDSNSLLFDLARIMASTLRLEILLQQTLYTLLRTIKIERIQFIIFRKDTSSLIVADGYERESFIDEQKIYNYAHLRKMRIYDEEEDPEIKESMRMFNISILLPLYVGDNIHGVLLLGEKKSGELYSSNDLHVLKIFGPEISIAIQNAKSYEEISQFNMKLHEEVDKATQEARALSQEIYKKNVQLHQLDKLKDDFVSVASHELRTPMTAIKSYLWMALNKRRNELTPDVVRYLDKAYLSVDRLINLVNDMLNVSRIEGGRIALDLKATNIVDVARDVLEEIQPRAYEKGVNVLVDVAAEPPHVLCDANKIHEVILNLVGNSLKFTPKDGKITVTFAIEDQHVRILVKDTGRGIMPEDLPRLFAKFGRLENSYVAMAESSGTGLGLYISRALVELHKGEIKGQSEGLDKGATFSFTLPIVDTEIANQLEQNSPKPVGEEKQLEHTSLVI